MHRISLAPELSATRRRVSCWITASPRPLQDLEEPPALSARERARLLDADDVALAGLVLLVVGVQRVTAANDLLVDGVAPSALDAHGDRLVGPRGDDRPGSHLPGAAAPLRGR